jgi:hypothetical protein
MTILVQQQITCINLYSTVYRMAFTTKIIKIVRTATMRRIIRFYKNVFFQKVTTQLYNFRLTLHSFKEGEITTSLQI